MIARPTILITGATKGIGRALVERFAASAGELHLVARNARDLESLQKKLQSDDCRVHVYPADLSKPAEVTALVDSLRSNMDALAFAHQQCWRVPAGSIAQRTRR